MPLYKYIFNRMLTATQNFFLGSKLSEFHSGYRAFSKAVLEELPLLANSDDFVFDNQMLVQCIGMGCNLGEISVPTKYFPEASSINFRRSVIYGLGVLVTTLQFVLWKWRVYVPQIFRPSPTFKLGRTYYQRYVVTPEARTPVPALPELTGAGSER
jgi:hypothetical protein